MRRRDFITLLGGVAASWPLATRAPRYASAQTVTKVFSVGWLTAQRASSLTPFLDVLRSGLGELGYREGDNLKIEYRFGDDNLLRVAPLAAELVRHG
jgi:putative tryptophan/tyrosine transport system substrate-binding protein